MSYEITKDQFELFESECDKWINRFGLLSWNIHITHKELDKGILAQCSWDDEHKKAWIALTTETDEEQSDHDVRRSAFHEICELVLCKLNNAARETWSENRACAAVHDVIRILENCVWFPECNE